MKNEGVAGKGKFQFSFEQRYNGADPICSCCHTTVAAGARRLVRANHDVHAYCAEMFDAVMAARADLAMAFKQMPGEFFGDSKIIDRLGRICTYDGLRNLLRDLASLLHEKKDQLRQMVKAAYADIVARLRAAANKIRMGHLFASALT